MDTVARWTDEELREVRARLTVMVGELEAQIAAVDADDVAQMAHVRALLDQTNHVIQRLDDGLYGVCEGCDATIARERLEAFPRATTCTACARVVTPN